GGSRNRLREGHHPVARDPTVEIDTQPCGRPRSVRRYKDRELRPLQPDARRAGEGGLLTCLHSVFASISIQKVVSGRERWNFWKTSHPSARFPRPPAKCRCPTSTHGTWWRT